MGLTNHTRPISHHITPLVIDTLRGGHTDWHTDTGTDTHNDFKKIRRAWPKAMHDWFKKFWVEIITAKQKPNLRLNASQHIFLLTFING